jgi:hypothetical protein
MSGRGVLRSFASALIAAGLALTAGCKQGHKPDVPVILSGPTSGAVGVGYSFAASAADHDGDDVALRFDWGDGDTSDWSDWVRPGDTVTASHTWRACEVYSVRAQAKARNFTFSGWSDVLYLAGYHEWYKAIGGPDFDEGWSAQQTQDGGYVIAGYTRSYGAGYEDAWLVKTDANGDTVWTRTFGGPHEDLGRSVQQTLDGGYVITGYKYSGGGSRGDVWLVKTDADGVRVWDKTFGGPDRDEGYSVRQTRDGGYIVTGEVHTGVGYLVWLLKTDSHGDTVWTRTFGSGWCEGRSVQQTQDGGYIVAAIPDFGTGRAIWLIRTDSSGNETWTKTFGGVADYYSGMSVQQTLDGGYVVVGTSCLFGGGPGDVLLVRTDSSGEVMWERLFGGECDDWGNSVHETRDGGYIIAGNTRRDSEHYADIWLIRISADGDTIWTRTFGGEFEDRGYSVDQTEDGGFAIVGTTWLHGYRSSDVLFIKTGPDGNVGTSGVRSAGLGVRAAQPLAQP